MEDSGDLRGGISINFLFLSPFVKLLNVIYPVNPSGVKYAMITVLMPRVWNRAMHFSTL